jgi:hypothetical protein
MVENNENDPVSGDTLSPADFPLNSPESRAAARRRLRVVEHVVTTYWESSPDGPRECDPISARVDGGGLPELSYQRRDGETVNAFKSRVYEDLPATTPMRFVSFLPRKDSPDQGRLPEKLPESLPN